jgi:hypothetical protein
VPRLGERKANKMIERSVVVYEDQAAALRALARVTHVSACEFVRQGIALVLEKQKAVALER